MRLKKLPVFLLCLAPLGWLLYLLLNGEMEPDPGKEIVLFTGIWALRLLVVTLAITPARQLGLTTLVRYRRMLGLYVWFYASLHLLATLTWLLGWSWTVFIEEFTERPYMALGMSAWLLLVPLGLTSNRWMMKKTGRYWKPLHRLVYLIALLSCAHFIWLVRSDYLEAATYSVVIVLLLLHRLMNALGVRVKPFSQITRLQKGTSDQACERLPEQ